MGSTKIVENSFLNSNGLRNDYSKKLSRGSSLALLSFSNSHGPMSPWQNPRDRTEQYLNGQNDQPVPKA